MAATLQLTTNSPEMVARIRKKAPIAQMRAINRALGSANAAMLRVISTDLGVKVGDLRDKIKIQQATLERLTGRLYASAKRIPLIDFNAKGPEPSRGRGSGVTVKLGRSRSRYPQAFIARMASGHRGVFRRVDAGVGRRGALPNRAQLPIRELFGPSIWKVFTRYQQVGIDRGREALIKNLQSEFRFVLAVDAAA